MSFITEQDKVEARIDFSRSLAKMRDAVPRLEASYQEGRDVHHVIADLRNHIQALSSAAEIFDPPLPIRRSIHDR